MKKATALIKLFFFLSINMALLEGCKKEIKEQTDLIDYYQLKLKDQPARTTQVVNLRGKGYYGDINGNRITLDQGNGNTAEATSCPGPGDSEFVNDLVSITTEYTCNVGYRFLVTYRLTSEFYPQLTNGGSLFSRGRIKLLNGGTQVYITPTTTINPVLTIQNNGVVYLNSNGDDMNEFIITYRSEIVSEATFNSATAIQCNLTCYTDCTNYATLNISFSSNQSIPVSQQTSSPCLRIDKVWFNPSGGGTPANLAGCDPVGSGCFPWGYVYPEKQEIEFKNGSNVWKKFYLHINGLGQPGVETGLINFTEKWYIDVSLSQSNNGLVPGNVQVRYRNRQITNGLNGGPCVTQPDGTYVTETWYIN